MRHLIDIASLSDADIQRIFDLADRFQTAVPSDLLARKIVINLFYEPSTRTRVAFEVAAKRLGAAVVNLSSAGSSVEKGETLEDTFRTLQAMQPDAIVVRHPTAGTLAGLAQSQIPVLNAGDGSGSHPSQALLDAYTLRRARGELNGCRLAIVGDIRHSRVVASNVELLTRLGVKEIRLAGPEALLPDTSAGSGIRLCADMDEAVDDADAIMMLRIQKERIGDLELPSSADYHRDWGLTEDRLRRAGPNCVVMHPGPINRGVEISSKVADGPQSVIWRQVANGVFVRMAIFAHLLRPDDPGTGARV